MLTLDTLLKTGATGQYLNFDFNSMCGYNGRYIGANENGLFALEGDSDNGADIDAFLETRTDDMGLDNPKRLRFLYLAYEADGDLAVTVTAEGNGSQTKVFDSTVTGQQRRRKSVTRALKSKDWKIKVANTDGCDFSLNSIKVLPVILSHGYK